MRATVFLPDYLIRMHTYSRRCRIQLYGFSRDTLYTYGITFVCMCMLHVHVPLRSFFSKAPYVPGFFRPIKA